MLNNDQRDRDVLEWLLEPDMPGVRYLALRDLLKLEKNDPELCSARRAAHTDGPIAVVLNEMDKAGYWVRPGPGYNPKYRSAVWSLTLLAQLGASIKEDERISTACNYILDHAQAQEGQFSTSGAPSGTIDCLQGNLCRALAALGCEDPRLEKAYDWMARTVIGEGIAPPNERDASIRYYAYKCGPLFACGVNNSLPCAWGAVKVMQAFDAWPPERRTPRIEKAIEQGAEFFLGVNPAGAGYPTRTGGRPSPNWWKFGFPVFYITDLLQLVEALAGLGYGHDPRLENALELVRKKQNERGRWLLEYDYAGKTWGDYGEKKQENKWVTLRALHALSLV